MVETLVNTIRNSAIVKQRSVHMLGCFQYRINAFDVKKRLLLTSKRGIRQVLCSGG
ncbi:Uncharacterised protein [Vibrio cholerae]|nr:Uncharacterised protein [Vibrio cholerae]